MTKFPYTTKPEDITALLEKIPESEIPADKVNAAYIKSLGFSASSTNHLLDILKILGFVNEQDEATSIWQSYAADAQRGLVLASAIKKAYGKLFELAFCPYLESDDNLIDIFKHEEPKTTPKDMALILETFRRLSDLADFQELMCVEQPTEAPLQKKAEGIAEVKVNPNLQLNIQIHIDPNTPEEKIEAIFKNMKKYLMEK